MTPLTFSLFTPNQTAEILYLYSQLLQKNVETINEMMKSLGLEVIVISIETASFAITKNFLCF